MATAVLRERGPRLACFGYFGHMWELYAMWTWLGAFLAASLEARGGGSFAGLNASAATFACVGLAGGLGAYGGGPCADRWGRTTLTMAAMALSGLCALLIGFTFAGPPLATLLVALVWGVTVIADSAQFSTAVTELAAGRLRGHRAHHPDLPGLCPDHGLHLAHPAGGRDDRLALGLRHARDRPGAGGGGDGPAADPARGRGHGRWPPLIVRISPGGQGIIRGGRQRP